MCKAPNVYEFSDTFTDKYRHWWAEPMSADECFNQLQWQTAVLWESMTIQSLILGS